MIDFRPFAPADFDGFHVQPAQAGELALAAHPASLAASGPAFTASIVDRPIGCAGLWEVHRGYASAWCRLAHDAGPWLPAISRAVRRVLATSSYARIDTMVRSDFQAGQRWMGLLGFAREARMRNYGPNGEDYDLFALVRAR